MSSKRDVEIQLSKGLDLLAEGLRLVLAGTAKYRLGARAIDAILNNHMLDRKKSPYPRAKKKRGRKLTPALRAECHRLKKVGLSNHQIAVQLDLGNGGRISEILNKKR